MSGLVWLCAAGAGLTVAAAAFALRTSMEASARPESSAVRVQSAPWRIALRLARSLAPVLPMPLPPRLTSRLRRALARGSLTEQCDPATWLRLLLMAGLFAGGLALLVAGFAHASSGWAVAAALLTPWMAHSRLLARGARQVSAICKELPAAIDLMVLCLESGASLGAAMRIAAERQGSGPIQQLWSDVLGQVRAGLPRAVALRRVMESLDVAPVTALFTALIQAEVRGMSLGSALRAQSAQCLADRFIRAERAALQAPVKLLLPLLTCIFPCTFIVIAVPIAARFIGAETP